MSSLQNLKGSIVALVTPMIDDGDNTLDIPTLRKLVAWHISEGTQAIVVVGTTGESPTLDEAEWTQVIQVCVEEAKGSSVPIIAGTGTNNTAQSIRKTRKAAELGAAGALVVTPYYNKPTQEGLYQHYRSIAEAVPEMPIILYNVPGRTGCDMLPETARRLSEISNIIGMKEAAGKIERFGELRKLCGEKFRIYSGEDSLTCEAVVRHEADGVISVTANVVPSLMTRMCQSALEGDKDEAKNLNSSLEGLHEVLFVEPNPTATKWLLADLKIMEGGIRLPLLPLSASHHLRLQAVWEKMRESADCKLPAPRLVRNGWEEKQQSRSNGK